MYQQVWLTKKSPDGIGDCWQISWIPEKFAVYGKILDLKSPETGEWTFGWRVATKCSPDQAKEIATFKTAHEAEGIFASLEHNRTKKDKSRK